jgi:hypothetical protein
MSRIIDAYIQHEQWRLGAWGFGVAAGLWVVAAVISLYAQSRFAILSFLVAFLDVIIALGYYRHREFIPAKGWFEGNRLRIRTVDPCWRRLAIIKRNLKLKVISVEQDEDAVIVIGAGRWESLGESYRIRLKPGIEGMAELRAKLGDMKQAQ